MLSSTLGMTLDLEFRQLQVFCEVVQLGSFSRAAQAVGLAQASVSERISALEELIGERLLDRSGRRGVRPTPVGQALYDHAVRLLADRDRAIQEVRELLNLRQGKLLIGASTVPGTYHLPRILRQFRATYPELSFEVSIAGSAQVIDWVAEGVVEIGMVGDPGELVGQTFRGGRAQLRTQAHLWSDRMVLAVPKGHPLARRERVTVADLHDTPFVMREKGSGTRRWLEQYLQENSSGEVPSLNVAAVMGSLSAVKQAVIHGLGVTFLASCAVEAERDAGLLETIEFEGPLFDMNFYLVRDERRTASPVCRVFVDAVLDAAGATASNVAVAIAALRVRRQ